MQYNYISKNFVVYFLLVLLTSLSGALATERSVEVLFENNSPPIKCVKLSDRRANLLLIETRRGERLRRPHKVRRNTTKKLMRFRQLRRSGSLTSMQRQRIKKIRSRRKLARDCIRATAPEPTPEPTPVPTPEPDPTPAPKMCEQITVTFSDFTAGEYPEEVFNEEGDLLTEDGTVVNYNGDISFVFDKPYECGQFATGDWWVKGPVTVTEMTPQAAADRHGFDVDPVPGTQSLDGRIAGYSAQEQALPLSLNPEDSALSLIKASSFAPEHGCLHIIKNHNRRGCLLSAAVLTVVSDIPSEDSFRPPYIKGNKPILSASDLQIELLPRLAEVENTPDLSSVSKYFGGPWIDYVTGWSGRFVHPRANMRGSNPHNNLAYGSRLAGGINVALLRTLHNESVEEKKPLVIPIVQWGIDLYHQAVAGQSWRDDGGHMLGRKAPILYAGHLLQSTSVGQEMLKVMDDYSGWGGYSSGGIQANKTFQEDGHTYFGEQNIALFGGTKGDTSGIYGGKDRYDQKLENCNGARDVRDPDGYRDGGIITFSHDDPDTMPQSLIDFLDKYGEGGDYVDGDNPAVQYVNLVDECGRFNVQLPTVAQQIQSGERYTSAYQGCCTTKQYIYTATAVKLLGLESEWAHPAFFSYIERYNISPWDGVGGYGSAYGDRMFDAYYPED